MTSKLYRTVLLGTALGIPLFFLPEVVFESYSLPKLALLVAGMGIALGLLVAQVADSRKLPFAPLAIPTMAIVLSLALAWLWSPYKEWSLLGQYARYNGLLPYALIAVLGALIADAFLGRARVLASGLAVAGGAIGVYAFFQALGLDPSWSPGKPGGGEYPPSTIGHFNFLGGYLAICLPLCIYLWSKGAGRHRLVGLGATVAVAVGLLLSNSQGGWAAALSGVAVIGGSLAGQRYRHARRAGLIGAALLAFLVVGAVIASSLFPRSEALGGTVRQRSRLWVTALEMGADSPLVGRGPSSYSVEGVRYRSLDAILAETDTTFDDPHSVPLSFWANGGAIGAIGFLIFAGWIIATGLRIRPADQLSTAFFAACVAYLVQSLVSVDHIALRSAVWIAMAGMVANSEPARAAASPSSESLRGSRPIVWKLVAFLIAGAGLYYGVRLLLADHQAENGREHFLSGDVADGLLEFERASSFRFEPQYLNLYAHGLGVAGLDQGPAGADLIQRMRVVYGYLDNFPEVPAIVDKARLLHFWARFQPSANVEAQPSLVRARSLDPQNPAIDVLLSEVLIDRGMVEHARLLLEPWAPLLDNNLPDYWGALSVARLLDGDAIAASRALEEGLSIGHDCRVVIARELIRHHEDPALAVPAGTAFTLRSACGEGGYQFFLAHLPRGTPRP